MPAREIGAGQAAGTAAKTNGGSEAEGTADPAGADVFSDGRGTSDRVQLDADAQPVRASGSVFRCGFVWAGLLSVLGGIVAAMLELRGALHPVELETQFVSDAVYAGILEALHEGGAVEAEEHAEAHVTSREAWGSEVPRV